MRCSTVGGVVDAVRRGLFSRAEAVEHLSCCGFTEPERILDDLVPEFAEGYIGGGLASVADQLAAGKGRIDALDEDRPSPAEVTVHAAPQTYAAEASAPPPPPLVSAGAGKPRRVVDLPCPKCGGADVTLRWVRRCGDRDCDWHPEHFDHHCRRCGYDWVTTDMLDADAGRPTPRPKDNRDGCGEYDVPDPPDKTEV